MEMENFKSVVVQGATQEQIDKYEANFSRHSSQYIHPDTFLTQEQLDTIPDKILGLDVDNISKRWILIDGLEVRCLCNLNNITDHEFIDYSIEIKENRLVMLSSGTFANIQPDQVEFKR